jgi:hypothetical protein
MDKTNLCYVTLFHVKGLQREAQAAADRAQREQVAASDRAAKLQRSVEEGQRANNQARPAGSSRGMASGPLPLWSVGGGGQLAA